VTDGDFVLIRCREISNHLEAFAAAYLKLTGLPPDKCEMVIRPDIDGGWVYYFRPAQNDASIRLAVKVTLVMFWIDRQLKRLFRRKR